MATVEDVSELGDLSKMKVADLKKELKARGLSTTGNKLELLERLQNGNTDLLLDDNGTVDEADIIDEDAMLEDGLDDDDDDDDEDVEDVVLTPEAEKVLEDEPKLTKPIPTKRKLITSDKSTTDTIGQPKKIVLVRNSSIVTSEKENRQSVDSLADSTVATKKEDSGDEKKVVKISGLSMQERLSLRAEKFGPAHSDTSKKEARALRFGLTAETGIAEPVTADKLKKRAERFGTNVSSMAIKVEQAEKLKARQERFGVKTGVSTGSLDDKKKLRAERFKLN